MKVYLSKNSTKLLHDTPLAWGHTHPQYINTNFLNDEITHTQRERESGCVFISPWRWWHPNQYIHIVIHMKWTCYDLIGDQNYDDSDVPAGSFASSHQRSQWVFSRPAGAVLNTHTLFIQQLVSRHVHTLAHIFMSITVLCCGVK